MAEKGNFMQAVAKNENEKGVAEQGNAKIEKYLTFFIDGQLYSIPTSEIVEIIQMQPITFMPNVANYVKGFINLRGKVVPVIDMRLRFKKEEKAYSTHTNIIIVKLGETVAGMIVDSVNDVCDVAASQINVSPTHKSSASRDTHFVRGIVSLGNSSAMLLDTAKVLTHQNQLQKAEMKPQTEKAENSSLPRQ